jgi:polar amino acid transport system substrate-binding protein
MKKTPLIVVVTAVAFLFVGYYAGRRTLASTPTSTVATGHRIARDTFDQVKNEGRVIVGIGQEAAPFGYRDNGELVGYDVDIARAVVKRLEVYIGRKISLEFKPVSDETRISWVQSGEVHMSLCHTNITRKRLANVDFTVPYGWDGKGVLYRNAGVKRDLAEFAGKSIGIKRSSSSEGEINAYFTAQGWALPVLKQFDNHAVGIQALMDGQIDGFTDDNSIIINTAMLAGHKVGPGGVLAVTDTPYSPTFFGIGVPENDSKWRDTLNYCLHDLWLSGEFQTIYDKWFGPKSMCPIPLKDHKMEPFVQG